MKAEDYLELPPYIENKVPVVLDSKAKKSYDNWSGKCCCR